MTKSRVLMASILALALVTAGALWLSATPPTSPTAAVPAGVPTATPVPSSAAQTTPPTVGTPTATPSVINVNTPTTVTITVQITDTRLLAGGANLLRLNSNGTSTILGVMHDDGLNGDAMANDKVFTLNVNFNEPITSQIQLQVSAAFRGLLQRVLSTRISLPVDPISAEDAVKTTLTKLLQPVNLTVGKSSQSNASEQILIQWDAAQVNVFTILQRQSLSGAVSVLRSVAIASDKLFVAAINAQLQLISWQVIPDPRLIRTEYPLPNGTLTGQSALQTQAVFSIQVPDDLQIMEARFYQPNWSGTEFTLQFLGKVILR